MQTYFITANDTGVGKTYVTGLLARHFASQGKRVQIVKAIDCGESGDAQGALEFAASDRVSAHTLLCFPQPLAPLAAENSDASVADIATLLAALDALAETDIRLIEGAGGIAVPIDRTGLDWRDFAEAVNPDQTIVVVDDRLGAINQTRLTHAYLGDLPHAFILNETVTTSAAVKRSNVDAYKSLGLPLLARLSPNACELGELDSTLLTKPRIAQSTKSLPAQLEERRRTGIFRQIKVPALSADTLNLADNDYLGLSRHPAVVQATKEAVERWGTSSSASPLITGYSEAHAQLEATVSDWYGGRPALIWNSGYAANQSILKLFVQPEDLVIADRLIHNSLISGILQSGARLIRFKHNDLDHLESLLKRHAGRKIHLVTESVYSMDGDYPDLSRIAYLKNEYGYRWYLDEAHALGWYGARGAGLAEAAGVVNDVDILTGTLGKALASSGAYTVFGESWMRDYCINEAGEFIYSTYLPPASAAAANAAIGLIQSMGDSRARWQQNARDFRDTLRSSGWQVLGADSPIVPVVCGSAVRALQMAEDFLAAEVKVAAIRPPTVPNGEARLRLSLRASLTGADYQKILQCFAKSTAAYV